MTGYGPIPPLRGARDDRRTGSASRTADVGEVGFTSRSEALIKCRAQNRRRRRGLDGRLNRPSPFTRIRDVSRERAEIGFVDERRGREIQQPRCDDASTPPHFGDVGQVEVVLVVFGMPQRGRLGVEAALPGCAGVGVSKDVEPPSAYAAISPYSMPLCTIFTK